MTTKYKPTDPRGFDAGKSSEEIKEYHSYKADEEVARLVNRYRDAPQFLRLISIKLDDESKQLHARHMYDTTERKSPSRDAETGRFQSEDKEDFSDQYSPDGSYRGS